MTTLTDSATGLREPALRGQTVIVIGGSSGIGLETARSARAEGAQVVLTGRDPERLGRAAAEVGAQRHAAFDALDPDRLDTFFRSLSAPVDHVMVTAGRPYYAPLADMDIADAARYVADDVGLTLAVARHAAGTVRPGGTLLLMSGTGGRRPAEKSSALRHERARVQQACADQSEPGHAPHALPLLCARLKRPRCCRAYNTSNKITSSHWLG